MPERAGHRACHPVHGSHHLKRREHDRHISHLADLRPGKRELVKARDAIWRAWFAHDTAQLELLIPEALAAGMDNGSTQRWSDRATSLNESERFVASGGTLTNRAFRRRIRFCARRRTAGAWQHDQQGGREAYRRVMHHDARSQRLPDRGILSASRVGAS